MASVHFWTVAPESFIAPTFCGVEAIKLSGHVILSKIKENKKKYQLTVHNLMLKYFKNQ